MRFSFVPPSPNRIQSVLRLPLVALISSAVVLGLTASPASATNVASPITTPLKGVTYKNCDEVRAAGKAPLYAGQPGYSRKLDRDGDGVACEGGSTGGGNTNPPPPAPPVKTGPFIDVPDTHKFLREIKWMKSSGLTTGYADGSFHPQESLTREAMAAFLYRQAGRPAFTMPSAGFTDVQPGHKFYREIMWMKAAGLSKGYANGSYRPSTTLSRAAMAAFMYRQAGTPAVYPKNRFSDVGPSHQFYREIEWMRAVGITTGNADGTYRPNDPVTREAMAAFMYRQSH